MPLRMVALPLLLLLPELFALPPADASHRLCQVQGTCFECEPGHFSHFICRSEADCFPGEHCVSGRGFCCPRRQSNGNSEKCPDGSGWQRMCKADGDCLFRDEVCAEGKCCPSCKQRRVQALREKAEGGSDHWAIPQCTDDGRLHRPMQCTNGGNECFCVDKFGRALAREKGDKGTEGNRKEDKQLNCSRLREQAEERSEDGQMRVALSRDTPQPSAVDEDQERQCSDPLRVFRRCGSACPISCATRTAPRCPQEQCLRGCFCRLPYVILDANDPFGSRCVLPAECPLLQFTPELNSWSGGFFPAAMPALPQTSRTEKCADPLKNYQTCGTACPVGCSRPFPPADCPAQCVSGCFCRVPYLLRDPSDPSSGCVLPQQCPPLSPPLPSLLTAPSPQQLCSATGNATWSSCFSPKCARSCSELSSAGCVSEECASGCECLPSHVVKDKSAPTWECVLPAECPRNTGQEGKNEAKQREECDDPRKEFLACGNSCPLGCDRLDQPSHVCSPCASGCFCRNGFVFLNATDWRHSPCVSVAQCVEGQTLSAATTVVAIQQSEDQSSPSCPAHALDRGGSLCQTDSECGAERRCCSAPFNSSAAASSFLSPRRCVCADPNAIWTNCGPLCPDNCAQSATTKLCPGSCRPGCYCPPGFVRRSAELHSECIPIAQCDDDRREEQGDAIHTGGQKECGEALASATLYSRDGVRLGKLVVRAEGGKGNAHRLRLSGEFAMDSSVSGGQLLLSIHQFSDTTSDGCEGVGEPLMLRVEEEEDGVGTEVTSTSVLRATQSEQGERLFGLDTRIRWPDPIAKGTNPLIGHSVVLKALREHSRPDSVLGCAVLGIAPSC